MRFLTETKEISFSWIRSVGTSFLFLLLSGSTAAQATDIDFRIAIQDALKNKGALLNSWGCRNIITPGIFSAPTGDSILENNDILSLRKTVLANPNDPQPSNKVRLGQVRGSNGQIRATLGAFTEQDKQEITTFCPTTGN